MWSAASGSSSKDLGVLSSPANAASIESVLTVFVATSDRPVLSVHPKLGEGQHGPWFTPVRVPTIGAPASVSESVRLSPSVLSAGPVAQGLAGRGPPPFENA